jgi:hypothetical protein
MPIARERDNTTVVILSLTGFLEAGKSASNLNSDDPGPFFASPRAGSGEKLEFNCIDWK